MSENVWLILFYPMFPFDPYESRKPNICYHLICTLRYTYQGVRNVRFSDNFRGIKREH